MRRALEQAFHPTVNMTHLGEEQVQCESCRKLFWIRSVNLALFQQAKRAVLCKPCQKAATTETVAKLKQSLAEAD